MKKLYCYVDETGQDTAGRFFAVSVLITSDEQEKLLRELEMLEQKSNKRSIKWKKARPGARKKYIDSIANLADLDNKIFFANYRDSRAYLVHTADAISKSLRKKRAERVIIYVDALSDSEQPQLKRQLRPSVTMSTQVRRVRKEENNAFIRLVDAICGLVRDADDGNEWAKKMIRRLKRKGVLRAL